MFPILFVQFAAVVLHSQRETGMFDLFAAVNAAAQTMAQQDDKNVKPVPMLDDTE